MVTEVEINQNGIYWFLSPGHLMTKPFSAPEIICVRCTTYMLSRDPYVRNLILFERVDNNQEIDINHCQFCWLHKTLEEAEREKLKSLNNFVQDIKPTFRQLKKIFSEYKKLKKMYG